MKTILEMSKVITNKTSYEYQQLKHHESKKMEKDGRRATNFVRNLENILWHNEIVMEWNLVENQTREMATSNWQSLRWDDAREHLVTESTPKQLSRKPLPLSTR